MYGPAVVPKGNIVRVNSYDKGSLEANGKHVSMTFCLFSLVIPHQVQSRNGTVRFGVSLWLRVWTAGCHCAASPSGSSRYTTALRTICGNISGFYTKATSSKGLRPNLGWTPGSEWMDGFDQRHLVGHWLCMVPKGSGWAINPLISKATELFRRSRYATAKNVPQWG